MVFKEHLLRYGCVRWRLYARQFLLCLFGASNQVLMMYVRPADDAQDVTMSLFDAED